MTPNYDPFSPTNGGKNDAPKHAPLPVLPAICTALSGVTHDGTLPVLSSEGVSSQILILYSFKAWDKESFPYNVC